MLRRVQAAEQRVSMTCKRQTARRKRLIGRIIDDHWATLLSGREHWQRSGRHNVYSNKSGDLIIRRPHPTSSGRDFSGSQDFWVCREFFDRSRDNRNSFKEANDPTHLQQERQAGAAFPIAVTGVQMHHCNPAFLVNTMVVLLCSFIMVSACGSAQIEPVTLAQATPRTAPVPQATRPAPAASPGRTALVVPGANGLSILDPQFQRLYGPGVYVMDALANLNIGVIRGSQYVVAHRFRATAGGKATAVRVYWPVGAGYSAGNGGTISVRILPDDGSAANFPNLNAPPLSAGLHSPGLIMGRHVLSSFNDEVRLGASAPLVAGQLYHVVFENVDPDAANNHIAVNNVVTVQQNGRPARWLNPTDWASLYGYRAAGARTPLTWVDATRNPDNGLYYAPILQVTLDTGVTIGAADIETGNVEGSRLLSLNADQAIRERFTPRSTRIATGFSVQTSTTTGGELDWSVRQGDKVLVSGVISEPSANFATQFNTNLMQGVFKWYDIALPAPLTLQTGGTYDLVFAPRGSSQWRFADEYSGADRNFTVAFSESQAQFNLNGKWVNATHRTHLRSAPASNWRVLFHLAP